MAAGGVRVEVASDEAEFVDAAIQFLDARFRFHAWRLREHTDAHEIIGVKATHAMNEVVAEPRPISAGLGVTDVMGHRGRTGRENGEVGATLALQFELGVFEAFPDLVIADAWPLGRVKRRVFEAGDLALAISLQFFRSGRVVTVTVDDHRQASIMPDVLEVPEADLQGIGLESRRLLLRLLLLLGLNCRDRDPLRLHQGFQQYDSLGISIRPAFEATGAAGDVQGSAAVCVLGG